jgi:hypothetical protein
MVAALGAYHALLEAESWRGERCARALLSAMHQMFEGVYSDYARRIWAMSYLASGSWPRRPPGQLGALQKQLSARVGVGHGLLEPDAHHYRNAFAHNHIEYSPSTGSLNLFSADGWACSATPKDLRQKIIRIAHNSLTLLLRLRALAVAELLIKADLALAMPLIAEALNGHSVAAERLQQLNSRIVGQVIRRAPPPGVNIGFWCTGPDPVVAGGRTVNE